MAEIKYEEMYKALKEEAENALMSKSLDDCLDEFKKAVNEKSDIIHTQIDKAVDELLEHGLKALSKKEEQEVEKKEEKEEIDEKEKARLENEKIRVEKRLAEIEKLKTIDENLPFDLKSVKVVDFIKFINKEQNSINRLVTQVVKGLEDPLREIKFSKEGEMEMKLTSYAKILSGGKTSTEIAWLKVQNQPQNSDLDKSDESILNIHSSGCYSWYRTDKTFTTEENVYAVFESTVSNNENNFYFGVVNENLQPSSNCGCCTISQACYIYHSGNICVHGSYLTESAFEFKSKYGKPTLLAVRIMGTERKVYFTVDDKEEKGPYTLQGSKYSIAFGSCNTANGKIKILSNYFV